MNLRIYRVSAVKLERNQKRGCSAVGPDHDRYSFTITTRPPGVEEPHDFTLDIFAEPGEDIGLGPLVDEDAYDSGYLDAVDMAINAARDAMERGDNPADVLTAIRATYKERGQ